MSISYIRKSRSFVVGRGTKLEKRFWTFESAMAYRDAIRDMKEAGLL